MLVLNDMTADARVSKEAATLAAAGYSVTVLCLRGDSLPQSEIVDGYGINRVARPTTAAWRQPVLKLRQSRDRTRALVEAGIGFMPDVVHAHDTDTLAAAARISKATGAQFVYDAHELYPDMISEFGAGGSWPVQAYWKQIERRHVPGADAVITVSNGLAGELQRRFGSRAVVLRNVPPFVPVVSGARLRSELGLMDDVRRIVIYQGVLIPGRGLVRLVEAASLVPGLVLVVQGFGPEESAMRARVESLGAHDSVRFMGRIAPADLHEYACGADAGVVIYEHTTLNNYLAGPNKLYAYLMAGLPVASSHFPGLVEVVEAGGVGFVFDPADVHSIAAALRELVVDAAGRAEMGARARGLAEAVYNWDIEKQKLLDLYQWLEVRAR